MQHLLYPLAWAMMFASCNSCLMLYKGKLDDRELPQWLRGPSGRKYAYPLLFVAWFSGLGLLVFGFLHLAWYLLPVEFLAGLILSAVLQVLLGHVRFAINGPVLLVSLEVGLWISGS